VYTSTPADVPDPRFRLFEGLVPRLESMYVVKFYAVNVAVLWHKYIDMYLEPCIKAKGGVLLTR